MRIFAWMSVALMAAGCAKEVGRVANHDAAEFHGSISLTDTKPLDVWVHLDMSYAPSTTATFDVELEQDGNVVSKARCDALNPSIKMWSFEIQIGAKWSSRYDGKMRNCTLVPRRAGDATVRARFVVSGGGPSVELREASLVFKK